MSGFPAPGGCALPGLPAALDAGFVREVAAPALLAPGSSVESLALDCVRCSSPDEAVVGWRLTVHEDGGLRPGYLTLRLAPRWRIAREARRLAPRVPAGGVLVLAGGDALALAFPLDRVLRELGRTLRRARAELVRYRPEHNAVLRAGDAFVHVRAAPLGEVALTATAIAQGAGLRCPRIDGAAGDRVVRETPLAGRPFAGEPRAARAVGKALAALHAAGGGGGLPRRGPIDELDATLRACRELAFLDEELGARAFLVAAELSGTLPKNAGTSTIHGRLACDEVLVDGEEIALRGFGHAARGLPERDVASLWIDIWSQDPGSAARARDALLGGYGKELDRRDLHWCAANAALQSAHAPFARARSDWRARAKEIVRLAEQLAGGNEP